MAEVKPSAENIPYTKTGGARLDGRRLIDAILIIPNSKKRGVEPALREEKQ